jgi:transcriptional regulator with XRE-family HTH domain
MQGQELRALRKSMGMTQGQLAAALGFSQGFIGEMERDEKAIEPRTVLALRGLRAEREEDVTEHGFHIAYADRVDGWNVIFTHDGWRGVFGKRELVLYGHFKSKRHAERWARALEKAADPRPQRKIHRIVTEAVEASSAGR